MKDKGMSLGRAAVLALVLAVASMSSSKVQAQQTVLTVPAPRAATATGSSTIAVTDTFQQLWADQPTRVNCLVQNNGSATLWVFAGAGAASKARSVVLAPGQSWNCAQSGTVVTSAVQVTGTAGDAFTAVLDGSGTISGAPSSVTATISGTPNVNVTRIGGHVLVEGGVNGLLGVGGNVASGTADSGNPVKVGGIASATPPTVVTTSQRVNSWWGLSGNLAIGGVAGVSVDGEGTTLTNIADLSTGVGRSVAVANKYFNGTTWDRARGDTSGGYVRSNFAFNAATTITRPANTTAYSAGDVVGGAITFANMGTSGGRIMLTSTQLELDIAAIPAGMSNFYLALYNVTPPSALADNAPFDIPSGDRASFLGIVQLGTPVDYGATLYVEQNVVNKQIKLTGTNLFGYLVTVAGYTPAANSEVYVPTLHSVGVGL
jgi:hypothetical protein